MSKPSIYHRLNENNAILSVFKDQVNILKSEDPWSAIGTYDLDGCSCLLVMGTTPGSAILVARIGYLPIGFAGSSHLGSLGRPLSTPNYDEHYMSLVRMVINTMMSNPKLFQLPIVCGIFGQHKDDVPLEHLRKRTTKVFSHLNISLLSSLYEIEHLNGLQRSSGKSTVVAVQHPAKMPELYIGNCLVYPATYSGSLASIFDKLGLEQNGRDHGCGRLGNEQDEDEGKHTSEQSILGRSLHRDV